MTDNAQPFNPKPAGDDGSVPTPESPAVPQPPQPEPQPESQPVEPVPEAEPVDPVSTDTQLELPTVDPCADVRAAQAEAMNEADLLIAELSRLREEKDCNCEETDACAAEAAAGFRALAERLRTARTG